jgi:hypothetical protein
MGGEEKERPKREIVQQTNPELLTIFADVQVLLNLVGEVTLTLGRKEGSSLRLVICDNNRIIILKGGSLNYSIETLIPDKKHPIVSTIETEFSVFNLPDPQKRLVEKTSGKVVYQDWIESIKSALDKTWLQIRKNPPSWIDNGVNQ